MSRRLQNGIRAAHNEGISTSNGMSVPELRIPPPAVALLAGVLMNVAAFVFLPVFVLYMNRFQIEPEERALALKFGSEYAAYKARVRRWL